MDNKYKRLSGAFLMVKVMNVMWTRLANESKVKNSNHHVQNNH